MENDDKASNKKNYRIDRKIFFWSLYGSPKRASEEKLSMDKEVE